MFEDIVKFFLYTYRGTNSFLCCNCLLPIMAELLYFIREEVTMDIKRHELVLGGLILAAGIIIIALIIFF